MPSKREPAWLQPMICLFMFGTASVITLIILWYPENALEETPPPIPQYNTPPCYGLNLCIYRSGKDYCTPLLLCPNKTAFGKINFPSEKLSVGLTIGPKTKSKMIIKIYNGPLKTDDWFTVTTGISSRTNNWLLMAEEAANSMKNDCVVCLGPRPLLKVVPAIIDPDCVVEVMTKDNLTPNYSVWDEVFPLTTAAKNKPLFDKRVTRGKYSCIMLTGTRTKLGNLSSDWCTTTSQVDKTFNPISRADVWWWCGGDKLYDGLPKHVSGRCALISLLLPAATLQIPAQQLIDMTDNLVPEEWHRKKRSISWKGDDPTYIDAIGVPRGVPDEYKLVNQVAAGFENVPIVSALFPITPNKNVDRINYVHYNVQKLGNYTQQGFEAVHQQLAATSLLAFQNRIAVDMLLAEKGGVCAIFGDQCCTFIPNNTAADGSLTRAIEGLRSMNKRMKEQSGVETTLWDDWMNVFGKYKALVSSAVISIAMLALVLTLCGCCCIPCIRSLIEKNISTAIAPPGEKAAQMHLLAGSDDEDDPEGALPDFFKTTL